MKWYVVDAPVLIWKYIHNISLNAKSNLYNCGHRGIILKDFKIKKKKKKKYNLSNDQNNPSTHIGITEADVIKHIFF